MTDCLREDVRSVMLATGHTECVKRIEALMAERNAAIRERDEARKFKRSQAIHDAHGRVMGYVDGHAEHKRAEAAEARADEAERRLAEAEEWIVGAKDLLIHAEVLAERYREALEGVRRRFNGYTHGDLKDGYSRCAADMEEVARAALADGATASAFGPHPTPRPE